MAATSTLVRYEDRLDVRVRSAVAGFLAGYSGNSRVSYMTDLRLFAGWRTDKRLRLLEGSTIKVNTLPQKCVHLQRCGRGRRARAC